MNSRRKPDQLMLHAYFDGELGNEDVADVKAWLAENPDARSEVEKWNRQKSALSARFNSVVEEEIPDDIRRVLEQTGKKSFMRPLAQIAAAIVLFALGATSGWFVAQTDMTAQKKYLAVAEHGLDAYRVFVSEKRHPVEVNADQETHLVKWLSKRLGQPLKIPDLSRQNYELVGGRLLSNEEGPAALFMYEDDTGKRVTLYIAHNPTRSGVETSYQFLEKGQAKTYFWLDPKLGYALAGEMDKKSLLALADLVYQQIDEDVWQANQPKS